MISKLADDIIALINAKPRSPTKDEVEAVLREPYEQARRMMMDAEILASQSQETVEAMKIAQAIGLSNGPVSGVDARRPGQEPRHVNKAVTGVTAADLTASEPAACTHTLTYEQVSLISKGQPVETEHDDGSIQIDTVPTPLAQRWVNQVWNYCCEIQRLAESRYKAGLRSRWPTAFDLIKLCIGVTKEIDIHSDTVGAICRQFTECRDKAGRCPRFRASYGTKRALGWVPFANRAIKVSGAQVVYRERSVAFWKTRELEGDLKTGAFVQDARGRWYVIFYCKVPCNKVRGSGHIGIDLGLKNLATCSDGTAIPALRHYRRYEAALAKASRVNNKPRVRAIHAKIANARRHHLHEWSSKIARENELIVVGNVSSSRLAKTRLAKSVSDAGWYMLRHMLRYKASRHGAVYIEADERLTSQLCSDCGAVGGPKGIAQLGIRHWVCSACGTHHDRDVNAARNILNAGAECRPLVEGIGRAKGTNSGSQVNAT